jgi:hypothetical protein
LQAVITTYDGKPLVDMRTGARQTDGRLGGLGSERVLEEVNAAGAAMVLFHT